MPTFVEVVVLGALPAPIVCVIVVFPTFVRVVTRFPVFVLRMVVCPISRPLRIDVAHHDNSAPGSMPT